MVRVDADGGMVQGKDPSFVPFVKTTDEILRGVRELNVGPRVGSVHEQQRPLPGSVLPVRIWTFGLQVRVRSDRAQGVRSVLCLPSAHPRRSTLLDQEAAHLERHHPKHFLAQAGEDPTGPFRRCRGNDAARDLVRPNTFTDVSAGGRYG